MSYRNKITYWESHTNKCIGFAETVTTEQLLDADCTSCRVTQDKSAYWHPSLYFEDSKTGKFELVDQVGGMLACVFPT